MNKFTLFFMRSPSFLCFVLILVTCTACKKDKLTPETHTGANTFSCKINGVVYKPGYQELFGPTPLGAFVTKNPNDYNLSIVTSNVQVKPPVSFDIDLNAISTIGTYTVNNDLLSCQYNTFYNSNTTMLGTLTLTKFDITNHIVSGTFNFTISTKENPNNIIQITDGRFDLTIVH